MNLIKSFFLTSLISLATTSFVYAHPAPVHENRPAAQEPQVSQAAEHEPISHACGFFDPNC